MRDVKCARILIEAVERDLSARCEWWPWEHQLFGRISFRRSMVPCNMTLSPVQIEDVLLGLFNVSRLRFAF